MRWILLSLCVALSAIGCAGDDEIANNDAGNEDVGFRPAIDVPNAPITDMGSGDDGNSNSVNNTNNTDPDLGGCPPGSCTVGAVVCEASQIKDCIDDPVNTGCGMYTEPRDCSSPQEVCVQGSCQIPTGCIDNDNDQHGVNCTAGPDCDDADPERFPGNPEVCDGKDNDCNSQIDDGLGLGSSCTEGSGTCTSMGVTACDAQGMIYCDAPPAMGTAEICDGLDNDCDGTPDNNMACDICAQDPNEPNNTVATATPAPIDERTLGIACPSDIEFFQLTGIVPGLTYRVYVSYVSTVSNQDLVLYANGTNTGLTPDRTASSEYEFFEFTAAASTTYTVEVVNTGGTFNIFEVSVISTFCQAEDGFEPNDTPFETAFLFRQWRIDAAMCFGNDYDGYSIGEVTTGTTINVDMYDALAGFGDLDLFLYGDINNDGNLDLVASSETTNSRESITYIAPTTTDFIILVEDWDGVGDKYELVWDN